MDREARGLLAATRIRLRQLFSEREILVRGRGRVAYARLSPARQIALAGFVAITAAAITYSGITLLQLDSRLMTKHGEVERVSAAYRQLSGELSTLQRQLEERTAALQEALSLNGTLQRDLAAKDTLIETVTSQRARIAEERQSLGLRAQILEERVRQMQTIQAEIMSRLGERTSTDIAKVERVLSMVGLSPDRLLSRLDLGLRRAQGGPFVPVHAAGALDLLMESASYPGLTLGAQIDRLDNLQDVVQRLPLAIPTENFSISSTFGVRRDPINRGAAMHYGLDLQGQRGQAIMATGPGRVIFADRSGFFGRMVEIDHGAGITSRYAHLNSISVEEGQIVAAGERIGTMGSTGRATGVHLHYEIRIDDQPVNPMKFIQAGRYVLKNFQQ